ncbi:MAG: methylated-DNA--[protein]-cysteine S-methyltransferase [Syntrophales bacterium]
MTKNYSTTYRLIPSTIGEVGVVRRADRNALQRILLPRKGRSMGELIREAFPGAVPEKAGRDAICLQLRAFLGGEAVDFSIGELDLDGVGGFARRVLMADHAIPRGRVMTYGGLATKLGIPGGARAVGNVMAGNPFPLVIPCHRVVRSGGDLGGFGGGLPMKKALLAMEGVCCDGKGRVCSEYII